jgi:hypothetical protein
MSYDSEVAADSPQIYWKLQDTSGTSAADASGNSRPGTYNGTASTNYALNQSVSLLPAYPSLKSVKLMRDSATESGHPTTRTNLSDASTFYGKCSVSRSYESWMNASGAAYSIETWFQIPATLNRYAQAMALASRRVTAPLQWELRCAGAGGVPTMFRWETAFATAYGQPSYLASAGDSKEAAVEAQIGAGDYESSQENYGAPGMLDLFDGKPHHVVGACGAASMRVFLDGVIGALYFASGLPTMASNASDPIIFGGLATSGHMAGFLGWMSHCASYGSELSAARVAAHYTAGFGNVVTLNQQWALYAAQELTLSAGVDVNSTLAQIAALGMLLDDAAGFGVDMMLVMRQAMALAATVNASTLLAPTATINMGLMDAVTMADALTASKFAQFVFNETMGVQSALALNSVQTMHLSDTITGGVLLRAGDEEFYGWFINPNLAASTAADGMNFLSMARQKNKHYGLKADGLYRIGGAKDAGANIDAFVSFPKTNFGSPQMKCIPYAYFGMASEGTMLLRVIADGKEYIYKARNPSEVMAEQRIDIGKGLKANYWQFELMNQSGEDFDLDTIKFMPVVLERRI